MFALFLSLSSHGDWSFYLLFFNKHKEIERQRMKPPKMSRAGFELHTLRAASSDGDHCTMPLFQCSQFFMGGGGIEIFNQALIRIGTSTKKINLSKIIVPEKVWLFICLRLGNFSFWSK